MRIRFRITHWTSEFFELSLGNECTKVPVLIPQSPTSPQDMDWTAHYPHYVFKAGDQEVKDGTRRAGQLKQNIEVADIGCGFGGLLFALAPKMPESLILGMCWE